jgi:hypothetical protein
MKRITLPTTGRDRSEGNLANLVEAIEVVTGPAIS